MKLFISIILIITGLIGAFLIMDCFKEASLEANVQDSVEVDSINIENNDHSEEKFEDDHEHDHSVEIEGSEIKLLTIQKIADLWEINSEKLLGRIIQEFDFQENYTTETILEEMRNEYKFSPAIIKDIAEEIKQGQ